MTSELKVDKITPASGTNTQIGEAGDTTNLSAGTVTLPTSIITGQTEKTSLADADKFLLSDSAASGAFKYVTKANLGGGSHVLLASSASESATTAINFDNVFSTTYSKYLILALRLTSSGNNENIYIQMRTGGSNQTSSAYNYILTGNKSNTTGTSNINVGYNNQAQWMVTRGLENTDYQGGAKLSLHVFDPAVTGYNTAIHGVTSFRKASTGDYEAYTFGGQREQTGVVHDGISIYISGSGNINQHRVYVYGVIDS